MFFETQKFHLSQKCLLCFYEHQWSDFVLHWLKIGFRKVVLTVKTCINLITQTLFINIQNTISEFNDEVCRNMQYGQQSASQFKSLLAEVPLMFHFGCFKQRSALARYATSVVVSRVFGWTLLAVRNPFALGKQWHIKWFHYKPLQPSLLSTSRHWAFIDRT